MAAKLSGYRTPEGYLTYRGFYSKVRNIDPKAGYALTRIKNSSEWMLPNWCSNRYATSILLKAFNWANTEEGLLYWGEIFDKLDDSENLEISVGINHGQ